MNLYCDGFVLDVRDFGWLGDLSESDSLALASAVEALRLRGGGVLYIPPKSSGNEVKE